MSCEQKITENHTLCVQDEPVSTQVVEAVAEMEDTGHTELPPLFDTIDPDALDTIAQENGGAVSFQYAGYALKVRGTMDIVVQRPVTA